MLNDVDRDVVFETGVLIDQAGGAAKAMPGDLTQPDFPDKLVKATLAGFGSIDIIVNNAGYTWDNVIQKTTDDQFQAMLDIHMVAPFRVLRAASTWIRETAKKEIAEGRQVMRKVVNITSISGMDGIAGQAGYGSGKAGIIGLTKVMAKEWATFGITVNAVCPGTVDTNLVNPDGFFEQVMDATESGGFEAWLQREIPLGRMQQPEEVASAITFLLSDDAAYITGEAVNVSGGQMMA